jgi:hypothetical protein
MPGTAILVTLLARGTGTVEPGDGSPFVGPLPASSIDLYYKDKYLVFIRLSSFFTTGDED